MRSVLLSFFLLATTLPAQAPVPQPSWLTEMHRIQEELPRAPLGSLDARVAQAWRAALQSPMDPQFVQAAQAVSDFYESQGYELKAEETLREALAAVPAVAIYVRRGLRWQLANHFDNTRQWAKALEIREEIVQEKLPPQGPGDVSPLQEMSALAFLYERLGEFEQAEALWKQVTASHTTDLAQGYIQILERGIVGHYRPNSIQMIRNELRDFYIRRGRTAEAEQLYQKALALQSQPPDAWASAAESYVAFLWQQRRFDEAIDLTRESITRTAASSDPKSAEMLLYQRERLADLLNQAGRVEEALAVWRQIIGGMRAGDPEYVRALGAIAQALLLQNHIEEAEQLLSQVRQTTGTDAGNQSSMVNEILAQLRDRQNRPEEARQLRANVAVSDAAGRELTLYDLVNTAQQEILQRDGAGAVVAVERVLAVTEKYIRLNPEQATSLMGMAQMLIGKQQEQAARRVITETLRILGQMPDHPRVADAASSGSYAMCSLGMRPQAEQWIERQERILIDTKGAESLALNSVSRARIDLLSRDGNLAGIIDERKRILARTENASGPKSLDSLYALREVAWSYPPLNNWPEEEGVLAALRENTARLLGATNVEYAQLLEHIANRNSENHQLAEALRLLDESIEITRALPDAGTLLPALLQRREQIAMANNAPAANPYFAPVQGAAENLRWFDRAEIQANGDAESGVVRPGGVGPGTDSVRENVPAAVPAPQTIP